MRSVLAVAVLFSTPAPALQVPQESASDRRVLTVPYAGPNDCIQILTPARGSTQFIISPEEMKTEVALATDQWSHKGIGNTIVFAANAGAPTTVAHLVGHLQNGTMRHYCLELTAAAEGVKLTPSTPDYRVASSASQPPPEAQDGPKPVQPYLIVRVTYAEEEKRAKAAERAEQRRAQRLERRAARAASVESAGSVSARAVLANDAASLRWRCNFQVLGSVELDPAAACSNGAQTRFLWPGQQPSAAVFLIAADGTEQRVTQSSDPDMPGYVVIPTTSALWAIRRGETLVAYLHDASWTRTGLDTGTDTLSPRVRTRLRASR